MKYNRLPTKTCVLCNVDKKFNWFQIDVREKDGLTNACIPCILDSKKIKQTRRTLMNFKGNGQLKRYLKKYVNTKAGAKRRSKPFTISKEDFLKWNVVQQRKCTYCDITEEIIKTKKIFNVPRMTLDRMNNKRGYTLKNICLACIRCNTIKGNCISYKQMKEIGQKYMKPIWQKELKESENT